MSKSNPLEEQLKWFAKCQVRKYFLFCPLCYNEESIELNFGTLSSKDTMTCLRCGAKWHVYFSIARARARFNPTLKWAKLIKKNVEGKGSELLHAEYEPEFWQGMALKGQRKLRKSETEIQEDG